MSRFGFHQCVAALLIAAFHLASVGQACADVKPPKAMEGEGAATAQPDGDGLVHGHSRSRFYGWQVFAIEYGALAVAAEGLSEDLRWAFIAGSAAFAVGGPAVHLAHRRFSASAISLTANVSIPLILYAHAAKIDCHDDCAGGSLVTAAAVVAALPLLDGLFLGWETVAVPPPTRSALVPFAVRHHDLSGRPLWTLGILGDF